MLHLKNHTVNNEVSVDRRLFFTYAGFVGPNTLHKTLSTTFFLYFACILPAIALGVLNYNNTGGQIGESVRRILAHRSPIGLC